MTTRTVADKLLIKPNTTFWVSHADRAGLIGPLPDGVNTVSDLGQATTALIFGDDSGSLRELLASYDGKLASPSTLWVAYPKGNKTDMNRDTLWPLLTQYGFRPIGQVAIDDVWSAMRFRPLKEGE